MRSSRREEFIDITHEVQRIIDELNIREGICLVFVPHTTAGVTVNEGSDQSVRADTLKRFAELVPENLKYEHLEGNADAHINTSLVGSSLCITILGGKLTLGTWQKIFLCEFDGPRVRTILVQTIEG
ncbi:MAG: secondary thiamine-phosphate synthase enzyme YjbQ [Pseudothermotoga sp.]